MPRDQLILGQRGCILKDKLKVALASESARFGKSSLMALIVIVVLEHNKHAKPQILPDTILKAHNCQESLFSITAAGSGERNVGKSHKSLNIRNYLIDEYRILKLACLYITSCVHGHTIDFLMVKGNPPFLRKLLALFAFYNFRTSVGVTA